MGEQAEDELGRMIRLCAARGLPEVTRGTSYGAPSLQVRGKSFATLRGPGEMVLHCPLDQKELLMEMAPEIYWQTAHFRNWPGLLVRLDAIGDEELGIRLEDAWQCRAPDSLASAFAARRDESDS